MPAPRRFIQVVIAVLALASFMILPWLPVNGAAIGPSEALAAPAPEPAPPQGAGLLPAPDLPPEATEEWWGAVRTHIRQDAREIPRDPVVGVPTMSGGRFSGSYTFVETAKQIPALPGIAGLSPTSDWTTTGENDGDLFGSVATAGDINGDGFADVIVGALGYPGGDIRGKVYLYLGSAVGLGTSSNWTATGENNGNGFGDSVATAGDVNGDGFADVIVGAPGYDDDGNLNAGKAYVYHGNDGGGRGVLARQGRGDGSGVPVQPWGLAHAPDQFEVQMWATDPMGRGRVKLQLQACLPGEAFTATTCITHTAATWTDVTTATSGIALSETITGLNSDTLYRWRARVLYAPQHVIEPGVTPPPNPAHGPWRRLMGQALEADLRTGLGKLDWNKLVYVNGAFTNTFPATIAASDTVEIVDQVWVSSTANVTFTLAETWTASLDLTGWLSDTGHVITTANSLTWNVVAVAPSTWYAITKTFHVLPGPWDTDTVTESLWVEDADPQLPNRVIDFIHCNYSVTVTPPTAAQSGDPGEVVTHTLRVTNTGNCSDTFDVDVAALWLTDAPTTIRSLDPGTGADVTVTVDVPTGAQCGDFDTATITFTSQGDSMISASSTLTTSANAVYSGTVAPPTDAQSGDPWATVVYTLTVSNTGNCSDTFDVSAVNVWPTAYPATVGPLRGGEGVDVLVTVDIPGGVNDGDFDVATVTFTSQVDGSTSAASVLTTTAVVVCEPVTGTAFTWAPLTPTVGEVLTFTAVASGTPPISFTWDLGDGTFAQGEVVSHIYSLTGTYTVLLSAANCAGAAAPASHSITVVPACQPVTATRFVWRPFSPIVGQSVRFTATIWAGGIGWHTETVDLDGGVDEGTSLALDSAGLPHICYHGQTTGHLKYAWHDGTSWSIATVDSNGGKDISLALDSQGYPHVSYIHDGLKYAFYDGTAWQIESIDGWGWGSSLALNSADQPRISYMRDNNLMYAWHDGIAWQTEVVDSASDVYFQTSLALDLAGRAHVAYQGDSKLRYAWFRGDMWIIEEVDNSPNTGFYPSLALDSQGLPHISYLGLDSKTLLHAWHDGATWRIETVDDETTAGWFSSISLDRYNRPFISYCHYNSGDLKFAWHDGATWQIEIVDDLGQTGWFPSLALDHAGRAHISYYLAGLAHDLKYARHKYPSPSQPISYSWSFGDDSFGSGRFVAHAYTATRTYTVTLTTTNSCGQEEVRHNLTVFVPPPDGFVIYLPLVFK